MQSALQRSELGSETESLTSDLPPSENSLMANQPDRSMTAVAKSAHHANDLRTHNRLKGKRSSKASKKKHGVQE